MPEKVFVSYSHSDKKWLDELKRWLKPLEEQGLFEVWDDTKIRPGDIWLDKIKQALSEAKAAILLVSQDFLVSDFIADNELPPLLKQAAEDGLKIFWIAVSASTVGDTEISRYQAVIDPGTPLDQLDAPKRQQAFLQIYQKIKEVAE